MYTQKMQTEVIRDFLLCAAAVRRCEKYGFDTEAENVQLTHELRAELREHNPVAAAFLI